MKKLFGLLICVLLIWGLNSSLNAELSSDHPAVGSGGEGSANGVLTIPSYIQRMAWTGSPLVYALSSQKGFLVSTDGGSNWQERNQGLPTKMIYPFKEAKLRRLTALGFDPTRPDRVATTTANTLFLSENAGQAWQPIHLPRPFLQASYITAIALSPEEPGTIFVGTSFEGVFISRDTGKSWVKLEEGLGFLCFGAGFWEEISGLACDLKNPDQLILSCGFGKGLYRYDLRKRTAERIEVSGEGPGTTVRMVSFRPESPTDNLKNAAQWRMDLDNGEQVVSHAASTNEWTTLATREPVPEDTAKTARFKQASAHYGIYSPAYYAQGNRLDAQIALVKKKGLNAIVVDCKDDSGNLTYDSQLPMPKRLGAVRPLFNLDKLVEKAKANGIYVIARVVVFKDERLYNYDNYKYALWDKTTKQPWRNLINSTDPVSKKTKSFQGEFWVDTFASDVWEYNLAIAGELQSRGVDEIQFDYIRFPTDGPLSRIQYRYMTPGMEKIDALESFLALARERISIPISTDLYGFNCWSRMDGWNGQNIELISDYVDAVCPMFYPSHFPSNFMPGVPYLERAQRIYQEGSMRAIILAGGRCVIRPYVQAFLLGGERRMQAAARETYLANQINGAKSGGASGFTLWNAGNSYSMMTKTLATDGSFPTEPVK